MGQSYTGGWSMMAAENSPDLNGKRIVVVEDDFLLATDICRDLRDPGATVLGPAPTPFYAMHLIGGKKIDAAVLDVRLHGATVFEVADMLQDQGVPILFATSYERKSLPARFQHMPILEKPLDRQKLVAEVCALTRQPAMPTNKVTKLPPLLMIPEAPVQAFARALARGLQRHQLGRR